MVTSWSAFAALVSSTWISTGAVSRIRTRALVADHRRSWHPGPVRQPSRAAVLVLRPGVIDSDAAAREEVSSWTWFLPLFNGAYIRPRRPPLFDAFGDGDIASDASDKGIGAFVRTCHGNPATPASSCRSRNLAAFSPACVTMAAQAECA